MVIEAHKAAFLIRYNNYKKTDFIEEHNKVVDENGYVWMLKAGRKLVESKLSKVFNDTAMLILKAPKSAGGNYYYTQIFDYRFGKLEADMKSPEYYNKLVDDEKIWQIDSLEGTWLKISRIQRLSNEIAKEFKLISNNKYIDDVIGSTMSATLYIQSDKTLEL